MGTVPPAEKAGDMHTPSPLPPPQLHWRLVACGGEETDWVGRGLGHSALLPACLGSDPRILRCGWCCRGGNSWGSVGCLLGPIPWGFHGALSEWAGGSPSVGRAC